MCYEVPRIKKENGYRGRGRGQRFMDTVFQLCKMKKFWGSVTAMRTYLTFLSSLEYS